MAKQCNCLLCEKYKDSLSSVKRLAWTTLCRIALLHLTQTTHHTDEYVNVRDIFIFVEKHWDMIGHLEQLKKDKWKKSILDALNQSEFFTSGVDVCHTNGYWKLTSKQIPTIKYKKDSNAEKEKEAKEVDAVKESSNDEKIVESRNNDSFERIGDRTSGTNYNNYYYSKFNYNNSFYGEREVERFQDDRYYADYYNRYDYQ